MTKKKTTEDLRKYSKGAPRKITVDFLNRVVADKEYDVIARCDDPNYCKVKFNKCNHEKDVVISGLAKQTTYCTECYDTELSNQAMKKGFTILSKVRYGDNKSSYESRLTVCNACGYFMFLLPVEIRSEHGVHCPCCNFIFYQKLALSKGYKLIGRLDKCYLSVECCTCGNPFKCQGSNLRRTTPRCPCCGKKDNGSFVYVFTIGNAIGSFVKIGKSNNPYLRHLSFSEKDDNQYTFIISKYFESEPLAFSYEKSLLAKYSSFNLSKDFAKLFIDNGFSEVFSHEILLPLLEDFNA